MDKDGAGFLGVILDFILFGNKWICLCFVEEIGLELGHPPFPPTVQHFNKDLFSSPPTLVFGIRLCLVVGS